MSLVCSVCPHACRLGEGDIGRCHQRTVRNGQVISLSYGQVTSLGLDPVEKKPLYHFHPGKLLLSVGSQGCNLSCVWCQNHQIAQRPAPYRQMGAQELVALALQTRQQDARSVGLAFTYNEPVIGVEWVQDAAQLARDAGLVTALVTNGYMNPAPWRRLLRAIDAVNIDVKAFDDDFYQRYCGGGLAPVLRNVEAALERAEVELTYLVIPDLNDSKSEVMRFVEWVAKLSEDIPVHLSRFFPSHRLRFLPPTPLKTMLALQQLAQEKLNFVYLGNTGGLPDTSCPDCGQLWIRRSTGGVEVCGVEAGHCQSCGRAAYGVGLERAKQVEG